MKDITVYKIMIVLLGIALLCCYTLQNKYYKQNTELKHQLELYQTNDSELLDCSQIEPGYIYQREDSEVIAYPVDSFKIVKNTQIVINL